MRNQDKSVSKKIIVASKKFLTYPGFHSIISGIAGIGFIKDERY